jgi:hypothetical protein
MHEGRHTTLSVLLLLGTSLPPPAGLSAQTGPPIVPIGRVDLFATTRDLQRGIRNNAYILGELDAIIGLQRGDLSLTAGAWSAFEPHDTRKEPRPDLRAGPSGLSDWSAWLQLTAKVGRALRNPGDSLDPGAGQDSSAGRLILSGGAMREWYRRVGSDPAVSEVYGTARLNAGRWTPVLAAWQAVSGADGLYLEPSLGYHLRGNPFSGPDFLVTTTIKAGFQVGHRDPDGGAKVAGPVGTGLTHVSVGVSLREGFWLFKSVALVSVLGVEGQFNRDPATKLRRDGTHLARWRLWVPIQLGLSYPLGRSG